VPLLSRPRVGDFKIDYLTSMVLKLADVFILDGTPQTRYKNIIHIPPATICIDLDTRFGQASGVPA